MKKIAMVMFLFVGLVLSTSAVSGQTEEGGASQSKTRSNPGRGGASTGKTSTPPPPKEDEIAEIKAPGSDPVKTPPSEDGLRSALTAAMVLKVVNPDDAGAAIEAASKKMNGYMSYLDSRTIVVKVPPSKLHQMMSFVVEQGYVVEKTLTREELSQEIAELEGRLKSKLEILGRLRGFFNDSDAVATLEIEQTMTGLVMEIEQVKGRLRVLNDRADWAVLNVSFTFRERDRVVYVTSPFEWLNAADLTGFIDRFEEDE